jgi:hypothetical protein
MRKGRIKPLNNKYIFAYHIKNNQGAKKSPRRYPRLNTTDIQNQQIWRRNKKIMSKAIMFRVIFWQPEDRRGFFWTKDPGAPEPTCTTAAMSLLKIWLRRFLLISPECGAVQSGKQSCFLLETSHFKILSWSQNILMEFTLLCWVPSNEFR